MPENNAASNGSGNNSSDFVRKLYNMLKDPENFSIVRWGVAGDTFVVIESDRFTKEVLPKHFKHSNFSSFVRQLNKYDFHKVRRGEESGQNAYGQNTWEFHHPRFTQDGKENLDDIRRKAPAVRKATASDDTLVAAQNQMGMIAEALSSAQQQVNSLNAQMGALMDSNRAMQHQLAELQKNAMFQRTISLELFGFIEARCKSLPGINSIQEETDLRRIRQELGLSVPDFEKREPLFSPGNNEQMPNMYATNNHPVVPMVQQSIEVARYGLFPAGEGAEMDPFASEQMKTLGYQFSTNQMALTQPIVHGNGNYEPSQHIANNANMGMNNNMGQAVGQVVQSVTPTMASNMSQSVSQSLTHNPSQNSTQPANANVNVNLNVGHHMNHSGNQNLHQMVQPNGNHNSNMNMGQMQQNMSVGIHLTQNMDQQLNGNMDTSANTQVEVKPAVTPPNQTPQQSGQNAQEASSPQQPEDEEARRGPNIYLVDDDKISTRIGARILEKLGCNVEIAEDGLQAVTGLNQGKTKYDLVFMDIIMPRMDGVSATACIREHNPNIPIVAVTSNFSENDLRHYYTHGMTDVLAKPFTYNGMLKILKKHLPSAESENTTDTTPAAPPRGPAATVPVSNGITGSNITSQNNTHAPPTPSMGRPGELVTQNGFTTSGSHSGSTPQTAMGSQSGSRSNTLSRQHSNMNVDLDTPPPNMPWASAQGHPDPNADPNFQQMNQSIRQEYTAIYHKQKIRQQQLRQRQLANNVRVQSDLLDDRPDKRQRIYGPTSSFMA